MWKSHINTPRGAVHLEPQPRRSLLISAANTTGAGALKCFLHTCVHLFMEPEHNKVHRQQQWTRCYHLARLLSPQQLGVLAGWRSTSPAGAAAPGPVHPINTAHRSVYCERCPVVTNNPGPECSCPGSEPRLQPLTGVLPGLVCVCSRAARVCSTGPSPRW